MIIGKMLLNSVRGFGLLDQEYVISAMLKPKQKHVTLRIRRLRAEKIFGITDFQKKKKS